MQVEIKQLDGVSKEISVTVESERVEAAYQTFLAKAARQSEVPGFRKGKAPLHMVQKLHGERVKDHFEKDFVDEIFSEVAQEHDLHFLLYPEIKSVDWDHGTEMRLVIQIEHEPEVFIKQLTGLEVPLQHIEVADEVKTFIDKLALEHATVIETQTAVANDLVELMMEWTFDDLCRWDTISTLSGREESSFAPEGLVGMSIGDSFNAGISGRLLASKLPEPLKGLQEEQTYSGHFEVLTVRHYHVPPVDDEFAKDMDFADLAEMQDKIASELSLRILHQNYNLENRAVIAKLFGDNRFPLPPQTLRYILEQELEDTEPKYREYMQHVYLERIFADMVQLYIMKALRRNPELLPEGITSPAEADAIPEDLIEQYIEHLAILEDISVPAYKDRHGPRFAEKDFRLSAWDYHALRGIAAANVFVAPPPEPETPDNEPNEEQA